MHNNLMSENSIESIVCKHPYYEDGFEILQLLKEIGEGFEILHALEGITKMIWVLDYDSEPQRFIHYADIEELREKDPLLFKKINDNEFYHNYPIYDVHRPLKEDPRWICSKPDTYWITRATQKKIINYKFE